MKNTKKNFLNSELSVEEKSKEKAKFHILPIPLEKTVSCGKGTSKGPEAIIKASNELERFTGKSEPCLNGIFTHPSLNCNFPIENVMLKIEKTTKEICKQNKIYCTVFNDTLFSFCSSGGVVTDEALVKKKDDWVLEETNFCLGKLSIYCLL